MKNITAEYLQRAVDIASDIDFTNEDIEAIFEKCNNLLDDPKIDTVIEKIISNENLKNEQDLKVIMKKLSNILDKHDIQMLMRAIIKDEKIVDFIQDLLLDKLL